jgi:AraC-like DNA-binding protein
MQLSAEELNITKNDIKSILDLLSSLFDIRTAFLHGLDTELYDLTITGRDGCYNSYCKLIQQELKYKCVNCDREKFQEAATKKESVLYRCHNGLYEMYLPLYLENYLVGYLHFGQVRSDDSFDEIRAECKLDEHSEVEELGRLYGEMQVIPKEKLTLIASLFKQLADQMLSNKMITLRKARPEFYLKKYVQDHLSESISVHTAANFINRSPSYVTHQFRQFYGSSFNQFLLNERVEWAKKLLETTSVLETAGTCGFKNRYHFSKVFKKITGASPGEYRDQLRC